MVLELLNSYLKTSLAELDGQTTLVMVWELLTSYLKTSLVEQVEQTALVMVWDMLAISGRSRRQAQHSHSNRKCSRNQVRRAWRRAECHQGYLGKNYDFSDQLAKLAPNELKILA
jgi:hypothetical protein